MAAVAYWRPRLVAFLHGARLTRRALAAALGLDGAAFQTLGTKHVPEAIQELRKAIASPPAQAGAALDAWIAKYLVDRGVHLLIDEIRRRAVLTQIRDADRRTRTKASPEPMVTMRVPRSVARMLQSLARSRHLPSAEAAIATLLDEAPRPPPRKPRRPASSDTLPLPDLLSGLSDAASSRSPRRRQRKVKPESRTE
ncbi:MAG: hypothetical protein JOZ58_14855 [Acetobacteraceae bacterium]|nr:hypothetical protein [Acetobacteraceae bacterium]